MLLRNKARFGILVSLVLIACGSKPAQQTKNEQRVQPAEIAAPPPGATTRIFMHNVQLHRAINLNLRVRWLRGYLKGTRPNGLVSLDDDSSFSIQVEDGEVAAGLDELAAFAQQANITSSAISDIRFVPDGSQLVIAARYRHILPIRVTGDVSPAPGSQVKVHVSKIDFIDVPVKGLMHLVHLKTGDLIRGTPSGGVTVSGDDIFIDGSKLLPPPGIEGDLRRVSVAGRDLVEIFGNAGPEVLKREQWRNYLSLKGGSVGLAKLVMRDADMMMIDTSADQWFDLDLDHYQAQLAYGYTRMTPDAGLQIFMPDLNTLKSNLGTRFNLDWLRNRNVAPPADVLPH